MKKFVLAPSVLAADFGRLKEELEMINQSAADWLHIDIMDGRFVPNISFGFPVLDAIKKWCTLPLDIHLMIVEPEQFLDRFISYDPIALTVHYEACNHLHRTIHYIKSKNVKGGVALNPHTPVAHLNSLIFDIDLVCMMSVNPGFGGQKFIDHTYAKVGELNVLKQSQNPSLLIEIDGGVGLQNYEKLIHTGADVLVAGNSVFSADNPLDTIKLFKSNIE